MGHLLMCVKITPPRRPTVGFMIETPNELYAHAIAIEREAAERYAEFAARMSERGHEALAELFSRLAAFEMDHLTALERRTDGIALPRIGEGEYCWLDAVSPEAAAHELIFRLLTPHEALLIALGAEKRAQAFFEHVLMTTDDPALRALAQEMAMEEAEHVRMVEALLTGTPEPFVDWASVYESN